MRCGCLVSIGFVLLLVVFIVCCAVTAASLVYLLEPAFNPALTAQAVNRVHRIGQSREVTVKHLLMRNTVEERIYELTSALLDVEIDKIAGSFCFWLCFWCCCC